MKHYTNEGKEILKSKKVRQYRSRQGRSDQKYEDNLRVFAFSFICLVITFLVCLIYK